MNASRRRGPPRPPEVSPAALERAALRYLERYDSTAANLCRVLDQRVRRAEARGAEVDRESAQGAIEQIVARLVEQQVIDDRRFAEARLRTLRRRGDSARMIRMKMEQKGVPRELIDQVLGDERREVDEHEPEAPELAAARKLARRRRLGPHRAPGARHERRERDLAALSRAGFSYDIARHVIDESLDDD